MTIKEARINAKLTQKQVFELFGIPITTQHDWEVEKTVIPLWKQQLVIRFLTDYSNGIIYEPKSKTIKEARTSVKLTQKQIFEKFGIPINNIKKWETGYNTPPLWLEKFIILSIENL